MFWIITALVVVVLVALAWWSSGRAKPGGLDRRGPGDAGSADAKSRSQINQTFGSGPYRH